jgi:hypothetical protein
MKKTDGEAFSKETYVFLGVIMVILGIGLIIMSILSDIDANRIFGAIGGAISLLFGIYATKKYSNEIKQLEEEARQLKENYFESLKGTDKSLALRLGREYYGSLREDGKVTTYDELAINNDLNSMKVPN